MNNINKGAIAVAAVTGSFAILIGTMYAGSQAAAFYGIADASSYEEPYGEELDDEESYGEEDSLYPEGEAIERFEGAFDQTVAVMAEWDPSFEAPPIVYYDGEYELPSGEVLDDDGAAWWDGKIYVDSGAFMFGGEDGEAQYYAAHELGHHWETYVFDDYLEGRNAESFADCIAGAVTTAAGWDEVVLENYAGDMLGEDAIHGNGFARRANLWAGSVEGRGSCKSQALAG